MDTLRMLEADLNRAGRNLDKRVLGPALHLASKPAVDAVRGAAPVGRSPKAAPDRPSQRRGGATRDDVRGRGVEGVDNEVVRELVGVSKKSGRVGWRTHFITGGTPRQRANPFIDRGVAATIDQVKARFMNAVQTITNRILSKLT